MSEEPEALPHAPIDAERDYAGDEHPLSLLLFSWMRGRDFDRFFLGCVAALCTVLAVLDLLVPRHAVGVVDAVPLFFAVFGFAAFGLAVLSGWPLGRLLRRPETYYDKGASASAPTPLVPTNGGKQGERKP